jgi:hypothetical protein
MSIPIAQGLCDLLDPAKYAWGIREREKEERGKGKGERGDPSFLPFIK